MSTFQEIKNKIAKLEEERLEAAKKFFETECNYLFRDNPDLQSFSWPQYTPYWNDGDECVFGALTNCVKINGVDEDDYYGEEDGVDKFNTKLAEKVRKFLHNFDDNDLKSLFGDHCEVIVTKDGVEVESYDHD